MGLARYGSAWAAERARLARLAAAEDANNNDAPPRARLTEAAVLLLAAAGDGPAGATAAKRTEAWARALVAAQRRACVLF